MRILSIETSCDETAIAIIEAEGAVPDINFRVLANMTVSQIALHREFGGVFPMLAKREHAKALVPLLVAVLVEAKLYTKTSRHVIEHPLRDEFQHILDREPQLYAQFIEVLPHINTPEIDAIAVTEGPGLEPALWVGINFAKALSMIWKKPIIPINHMEGHILASLVRSTDQSSYSLEKLVFPAVALLISGGHTELVLMRNWGAYELLGATRDDAVGEAFDKVARLLGLPYPGGPEISRIAVNGNLGVYTLPRPMLNSPDHDFSFAGLKTAVLYLTRSLGELDDTMKANIAREFEEACATVLTQKSFKALDSSNATSLIVGGGVSANTRIRESLLAEAQKTTPTTTVYLPSAGLSTDNALMIAIAGYLKNTLTVTDMNTLKAQGNLRITS